MNPSHATRNVIALVTAFHHRDDNTAAEIIAGMDDTERAVTLINAIHELHDRYETDAHERGIPFNEYIQTIAAASEQRATELGL